MAPPLEPQYGPSPGQKLLIDKNFTLLYSKEQKKFF